MFANVFQSDHSFSLLKRPVPSFGPDAIKAEHREPNPNPCSMRRQSESVGIAARRKQVFENPSRYQQVQQQQQMKWKSHNQSPKYLHSEEEVSRRKLSFTEGIAESKTVFTLHDQYKNSAKQLLPKSTRQQQQQQLQSHQPNVRLSQEELIINNNNININQSNVQHTTWLPTMRGIDSRSADSRNSHQLAFVDSNAATPLKKTRLVFQRKMKSSRDNREDSSVLSRRSKTPQLNISQNRMQMFSQPQQQLTEESHIRRRRNTNNDLRGNSERQQQVQHQTQHSQRNVPFQVIIKGKAKDSSHQNNNSNNNSHVLHIPLQTEDVGGLLPFYGKRITEGADDHSSLKINQANDNCTSNSYTDFSRNKENYKKPQHLEIDTNLRRPIQSIVLSKSKLSNLSRQAKETQQKMQDDPSFHHNQPINVNNSFNNNINYNSSSFARTSTAAESVEQHQQSLLRPRMINRNSAFNSSQTSPSNSPFHLQQSQQQQLNSQQQQQQQQQQIQSQQYQQPLINFDQNCLSSQQNSCNLYFPQAASQQVQPDSSNHHFIDLHPSSKTTPIDPTFLKQAAATSSSTAVISSLKSQSTFTSGIELAQQEDVEELHFQLVDFQQRCKQWLVKID